jgi:hypothetical protein
MAPLLVVGAVLLAFAGSAFGSDETVASAETEVDTVSGAEGQDGGPETLTIKSATKKDPLICTWETPLGSRVARRMCHRSSDVERAREATRAAAATVDEATTHYPRGG